MSTQATTRPGPEETLRSLAGGRLYQTAAEEGMTLSGFLEREHPQEDYKDGLDGFERMLQVARIRTQSDPWGRYCADRMERFDQADAQVSADSRRALLPEWLRRTYQRYARFSRQPLPEARALYSADDQALNTWFRPYTDAMTARISPKIAPAIPLDEVVSITTPIDGDAYRAFYLTDTAAQERLVRVEPSAELPRAKLTGAEHTVRAYKYGRILEATYESLRRFRIDMIALHIARIAIQAQIDKVATVIDVMVNGDGNSGTAATNYNLTTLDSGATAGTLTLKAWLAFKMKFLNPYQLTSILVQSQDLLQILLLNMGSANIPLVTVQAGLGTGGLRPINPELSDQVAYGITGDAPTSKILGFDARFAIERVYETGSDISEVIRWAERQTQGLSLSEVEGYATQDAAAIKTLRLDA